MDSTRSRFSELVHHWYRFGGDLGTLFCQRTLIKKTVSIGSIYYHPKLKQLRFCVEFNQGPPVNTEPLTLIPVVDYGQNPVTHLALSGAEFDNLELAMTLSDFAKPTYLINEGRIMLTLKATEELLKGLKKSLGQAKLVDGVFSHTRVSI